MGYSKVSSNKNKPATDVEKKIRPFVTIPLDFVSVGETGSGTKQDPWSLSRIKPACSNHTWQWKTVRQPNCYDTGLDTGVCTTCGQITTREPEALGHEFSIEIPCDGTYTYSITGSTTGYYSANSVRCSMCYQFPAGTWTTWTWTGTCSGCGGTIGTSYWTCPSCTSKFRQNPSAYLNYTCRTVTHQCSRCGAVE